MEIWFLFWNGAWAVACQVFSSLFSGLVLGLRPANERQCYKVTLSLIGWAQT